jgi:hypothetical protein
MVSCWAGSRPMTSTRALPSSRPRWKIGPHSTRNWPDGYTPLGILCAKGQ